MVSRVVRVHVLVLNISLLMLALRSERGEADDGPSGREQNLQSYLELGVAGFVDRCLHRPLGLSSWEVGRCSFRQFSQLVFIDLKTRSHSSSVFRSTADAQQIANVTSGLFV